MKILQLTPYYAPAWGYGGPPRVLFEIGRELIRRGHEVSVITTDAFEENRRIGVSENMIEGIHVQYLRNLSNLLAWRHKKFLPLGIRQYAKRHLDGIDAVHFTAVRSLISALTYDLFVDSKIPYFVDAHGSLPLPVSWKAFVSPIYDQLFLKPFLDHASGLFAQTEHELHMYERYSENANKFLLPLPIRTQDFISLPPRGELRKECSIDADEHVILFLGRIEERKGLSFLVRAFSEFLKQSKSRLRLLIVGRDAGGLSALNSLVKHLSLEKNVIIHGPLYERDRLKAYVDSDLFVLTPSYYEETSTASLEACMCAVPVIVTYQADIPFLSEYQAGCKVTYGDTNSLVNAFSDVFSSQTVRRKMGENARKMIFDHYTVEKVVDRFLSSVSLSARN